jgi:hypothetical protein
MKVKGSVCDSYLDGRVGGPGVGGPGFSPGPGQVTGELRCVVQHETGRVSPHSRSLALQS